jgi:hypothetical protein
VERADAELGAGVDPPRAGGPVRPGHPGPAAEVEGVHPAVEHLQPGVPGVDVRVGEGDVAGLVPADEGERLADRPLGQGAAVGQPDPQVEGGGGPARLGESRDQRVVHEP